MQGCDISLAKTKLFAPDFSHVPGWSPLIAANGWTSADTTIYPYVSVYVDNDGERKVCTVSDLAIGDKAPTFTLPRDGGTTVSPSDFEGKKVVVYFYPKDNTSGCTVEAVDFTALAKSFADQDVVVIGISPDSVKSHDRFVSKHELSVILAADEDHAVAEAYGVWVEKSMYGRKYMGIERSTFLIDTDGKIAEIWSKVKVNGHAQAVLDRASAP